MSHLDNESLFDNEEQAYKSAFFIVIVLYISVFYLRYFLNSNRLPGPVPLPLVGNLPHLILLLFRAKFNLSQVIQILHAKHGDLFQLYVPFSFKDPLIVISNAQIASTIFDSITIAKSKFNLRTGPIQGIDELDISKKGLFLNRDTVSWIRNKKFFMDGLASVNYAEDCVLYARTAFRELEKSWFEIGLFNGEQDLVAKVNLVEWIFRWTTDILFQVTASENVNSIQTYKKIILEKMNHKEKKSDINSSFKKLTSSLLVAPASSVSESRIVIDTETFVRSIQDFFPAVWLFLATPKWARDYIPSVSTMARRFKNSLGAVNKELVKIVKKKQEEFAINNGQAKEVKMDFLTMMITEEKDKLVLSEDDIRENLLHALAGGVNTLGNTLCFIVYTISKNPKVKHLVMQEIDFVFKGKENKDENNLTNTCAHVFDYEDLEKLKYTKAVIKEAMRILPTLPLNLRIAGEDCHIGEYQFKAGTQFIINQQGIHFNPKHWKNPTKFDPSRFFSYNAEKRIQTNSLLNFGDGTRRCPGKLLAMTTLKCFLALFYQKYDFVIDDNNGNNNNNGEWEYALIRRWKGGLSGNVNLQK